MNDPSPRASRTWAAKFRDAFRGVAMAVRRSSSFAVHLLVAALVIAAAAALDLERLEWCILSGCIAAVLAAETLNSALESLARAVSDQYHPRLRDALDMGSGAVLLAAIGAAVLGAMIFLPRLLALLER
jgi:diacylglycerol kinase (ATP)